MPMTNIQLQLLLEEAYQTTFLDSIEILLLKEPDYKRSEFFKKTKIPLLDLYKNYFTYMSAKYNLDSKINEFIDGIDADKLANLLADGFEKFQNNPKMQKVIKVIIDKFDLNFFKENNQELKKLVDELKIKQ
jgi:hypothetical protein